MKPAIGSWEMIYQRLFEQLSKATEKNGELREKVKDLEHLRDTSVKQQRMLSEELKAVQDKLVSLIWCD